MPGSASRVLAEDAELAVYAAGDGDAVVLVHGGLLEPMDARRFWFVPGVVDDLVAAGFRAIAYDRRFSGGSTTCDFAIHDWERETSDLARVIDGATERRVRVVAASNGCAPALRFAARRSDRVSHLVLCWPATGDEPKLDALLRSGFEGAATQIEREGQEAFLSVRRAALPFDAGLAADARARRMFLAMERSEAAAIVRATAARLLQPGVVRGVTDRDLRSVRVPTAVVPAPEPSPWHLARTVARIVEVVPRAVATERYPETPRPEFAVARERFTATLASRLRS